MATVYFANSPQFTLGSYSLSECVQSLTLTLNYEQLDVTTSGDAARTYLKGLAAHTISGTLYLDQDGTVAANNSRAVLNSLKGTTAAFVIKYSSAATSTDNPSYSGSCFVNNFTPVNGAVGDVAQVEFSFDVTTDVTIATS
jgi:hypothetical protein